MDAREQRGLVIAATSRLKRNDDGTWRVPSQSQGTQERDGSVFYTVNLIAKSCTCPDHQNGHTCKHYFAATYTHQREVLPDGTMIEQRTLQFTEKRLYRQDWRAYNLAQSVEKHRFQEILFDLLRGVPEFPVKAVGRRPHTAKDSIFAMALKVYATLSGRRSECDMKDAHQNYHTERLMPGQKICHFFANPAFTPILKSLIAHSATPLRSVETQFAIDSSGFGSGTYESWYDAKYGVTRRKCVWVKTHICCGVKTNIVTAVRILGKDAADSPQFVPLVKETRRSFHVGEVSADKAYGSVENFETVAEMGGQAFIAFKNNATGSCGGAFAKAFHYFQFKADEYMTHYHKRSNVESTFSAIKRKFGHMVRSKCDFAMVNEVLCKILCHNICCLIQEQCELGIEPVFWQEEAREGRSVLPMESA